MRVYKATIELFLVVNSVVEAYDGVSEILTSHLQKHAPMSCLADWQYFLGWEPTQAAVEELARLENTPKEPVL